MDNTQREILEQLAYIRQHMPNGELKRIENRVNKLDSDISDLKKTLLDPKEGLIVETNKNTEARKEHANKLERLDDINLDLEKIKEWRGGLVKALWLGFSALVAMIFKTIIELFR